MAKKTNQFAESPDFKKLVELLSTLSNATNQLEKLQNGANGKFLKLVDRKRDEYSRLQATITQTENELEQLAVKHPEWFGEKRSIKTPFGTVTFHSSSALDIENEELSVALIKHEIERAEQSLIHTDGSAAREALIARLEKLKGCIRTVEELDKESLEKLDDAELKTFKIGRNQKNNFAAKPLKLDLGKAIKESEPAAPAQ